MFGDPMQTAGFLSPLLQNYAGNVLSPGMAQSPMAMLAQANNPLQMGAPTGGFMGLPVGAGMGMGGPAIDQMQGGGMGMRPPMGGQPPAMPQGASGAPGGGSLGGMGGFLDPIMKAIGGGQKMGGLSAAQLPSSLGGTNKMMNALEGGGYAGGFF